MKQEMLINVAQPEECRIAIVEDGVLEELYVERAGQDNYVGNIYKGVVVNLEPSIQAAFVDFGVGRNGFLHISDVEPQYFRQGGYDPAQADRARRPPRRPPQRTSESAVGDEFEEGRRRRRRRGRAIRRFGGRPRFKPPIQEILRRGDEVLVQVIKEGHRHQGPHALHLHQHPRPLPGADARPGPDRRLAEDRRRGRSAAGCATSCSS